MNKLLFFLLLGTLSVKGAAVIGGPISGGSSGSGGSVSPTNLPVPLQYLATNNAINLTNYAASNLISGGTIPIGTLFSATTNGNDGGFLLETVSGVRYRTYNGALLTNIPWSGVVSIMASNITSGGQIPNGAIATNTLDGGFVVQTGTKNKVTTDGSGLTALNASQLTSGSLADARLSANVPLLNSANTWSANNNFTASTSVAGVGHTNGIVSLPMASIWRINSYLAYTSGARITNFSGSKVIGSGIFAVAMTNGYITNLVAATVLVSCGFSRDSAVPGEIAATLFTNDVSTTYQAPGYVGDKRGVYVEFPPIDLPAATRISMKIDATSGNTNTWLTAKAVE